MRTMLSKVKETLPGAQAVSIGSCLEEKDAEEEEKARTCVSNCAVNKQPHWRQWGSREGAK